MPLSFAPVSSRSITDGAKIAYLLCHSGGEERVFFREVSKHPAGYCCRKATKNLFGLNLRSLKIFCASSWLSTSKDEFPALRSKKFLSSVLRADAIALGAVTSQSKAYRVLLKSTLCFSTFSAGPSLFFSGRERVRVMARVCLTDCLRKRVLNVAAENVLRRGQNSRRKDWVWMRRRDKGTGDEESWRDTRMGRYVTTSKLSGRTTPGCTDPFTAADWTFLSTRRGLGGSRGWKES